MMSDGLKALGPRDTIATRDIAELVAEALAEKIPEGAPATA